MALPKLDVPIYELELPLSKKKIRYRPFLVKEQKNLLMAIESSDSNTVQQSVRDILNNCTIFLVYFHSELFFVSYLIFFVYFLFFAILVHLLKNI